MKGFKILIIPLLIIALLGFGMDSFAELHSKWSSGDLIYYDGTTNILAIKNGTDGLLVYDDINLTFGDDSNATLAYDETTDNRFEITCNGGIALSGVVTYLTVTDASSLTVASAIFPGGVAIAKQLFLGDDLDMSVSGTGVYDITLKDSVADALSIVGGTTDMIVFCTDTDLITITPPLTVTGIITATGGLSLPGGEDYTPLQIGVKSSSAGDGFKVAGSGDDSGGVQIYGDDNGEAAVGEVITPLRSRYCLTLGQTSGVTQAGIFAQVVTVGDIHWTTGIVEAAYIFNQAGTIELITSAKYIGINQATTLAGQMTVGAGCTFAGIDINIRGTGAIVNSGTAAGLLIRASETPVWPVGIQIADASSITGIDIGSCTTGINFSTPASVDHALLIGAPSTTSGSGLGIGTAYDAGGAPVGIYFDDSGAAITSWGEGFTVGTVYTVASEGQAQTGMPYTAFFYNDVRAAMNGKSDCGWSAVMMNFAITGAFAGFEVGVSSLHTSVDINATSTLAPETTLSCISFGGNWISGTYDASSSGLVVPLNVRSTNQNWSAFLHLPASANGCYEAYNAPGTAAYSIRVYVGNTITYIHTYDAP